MPLLSLSAVSLRFGANVLLEDVGLAVEKGERWGIIGRNGSGKTSLFRLITGELSPAIGQVTRAPGLRVAVLDQHRDFPGAATVWDAACATFAPLLTLEHELLDQAHRIGELGERATPEMLARYDRDLERFGREGGYQVQARVAAVLHGLGFDPEQAHHQALATLSGGERGRLGLAAQLVAPADLLLLDEPTNHLDLDTTAWLADHLRGVEAAVLIVSHDRSFLDDVVGHVLHLEAGGTQAYEGGYSAFVRQRAERRLAGQRAFDRQAKVVAAEADYIRRNIAGQNSRQAKGRRRRLERLPRLSPPPGQPGAMTVRFTVSERGGDQVLVADRLGLRVGDRTLLDGFTSTIMRGDVLGLIGPNGAGKTTLLATLLGERTADSGQVRLGDSTAVAMYRQDLGEVPRDRTLFDIVHDRRPAWTRGQVMDHLGRFDLSGDMALRRAGSLSGGELARVALAMMTLDRANVLVFDEPTNHLDVESIEALEDAIEGYDGTVILVSHDRALLRSLCTRIWSLEHGRMADYEGTFEEWEAARDERRRAAQAAARQVEAGRRSKEKESKVARPATDRRADQSAARTARRRLEAAEARVQALEARESEITRALADPALYALPDGSARATAFGEELERIRAEFGPAFADWESAALDAEKSDQ